LLFDLLLADLVGPGLALIRLVLVVLSLAGLAQRGLPLPLALGLLALV
jgi:hypothetical protein